MVGQPRLRRLAQRPETAEAKAVNAIFCVDTLSRNWNDTWCKLSRLAQSSSGAAKVEESWPISFAGAPGLLTCFDGVAARPCPVTVSSAGAEPDTERPRRELRSTEELRKALPLMTKARFTRRKNAGGQAPT